MTEQLQLFVCEHFRADTQAVLSSDNFTDVVPTYFPSRCGRPMPANKQLSSLSLFNKNENNDKLFCACSCLPKPDKAYLNNEKIKQLHLTNCFQMFAPKAVIDQLISEGAYLITPDWLTKWKVWVKQWGGKEQVRQMFSESVTKLVLLDTGVDPKSNEKLKDFSDYLNCPSETRKVGLDYYHLYLENEILKWRLDKKNKLAGNRDSNTKNIDADFAMALDLMSNLPRAEKEDEVANRIMDIFVMMFAAQEVSYLSIVDFKPVNLWSVPANLKNKATKERLSKCNKSMRLTESEKGFCMAIGTDNQVLAVIEIDEIAFPENMGKYQNLALAMAGVLALSIENSRYFQDILEMNDSLKGLNSTKDKLFSIIAHDLRSPFNGILGYSELLIENAKDFDVAQSEKFLGIINSSAKNTLILLDNLLDWAKSQTGQIKVDSKKIVLSTIISDVVDTSNSIAKIKNITLSQIQSEETEVYTDENLVKAVLRNLISNSIKFTKAGGKINVSSIIKQNHIEITVSDNGVGMSDETRKKLFAVSTNTTSPGTANEKGSGLGLVLCKEFVEKLGGKIWVKSKEGKGSDFKFTLPIYKP